MGLRHPPPQYDDGSPPAEMMAQAWQAGPPSTVCRLCPRKGARQVAEQALNPSCPLHARLYYLVQGCVSSEKWNLLLIHSQVLPVPNLCACGLHPAERGTFSNCPSLHMGLQWPAVRHAYGLSDFSVLCYLSPPTCLGLGHRHGQVE